MKNGKFVDLTEEEMQNTSGGLALGGLPDLLGSVLGFANGLVNNVFSIVGSLFGGLGNGDNVLTGLFQSLTSLFSGLK